jgi:pimeloyl-ACP methyl ester carboxylesterase
VRKTLAAFLVVAGTLGAPQLASAAGTMAFTDCGLEDGFQCARLFVPTDWTSPSTTKQIGLYVERKAGATQPATTALIALAGGPGQSATPFAESFAQLLAPALGTRDLIVYDQRGTGRSGYLTCPFAERTASDNNEFSAQCATELGPTRINYSTRDTVDDIEAIRQALGVDKVSIFGVSYGTYVAQLYARRYPTHTESLILDSVVPPTGVDPFDRTSFRAIKAELVKLCAGGRCRRDEARSAGRARRDPVHADQPDRRQASDAQDGLDALLHALRAGAGLRRGLARAAARSARLVPARRQLSARADRGLADRPGLLRG